MKFNKLAIVVAIAASCSVSAGHAAGTHAERTHARQSFSADVTRTAGDRSMSRHTEQVAGENQFRRESTLTTGSGKTANRIVEGNYNPETKTATKTVNGTRLNGDTYSAQRINQKTEDGYIRSQTRTNANGETASKQVTAVVNKDTNTLTKNITTTGFNGETHSATVVKSYSIGSAE